jgi:hypothetical protein
MEEGGDIVFEIKAAKSVINCNALEVLLSVKYSNVKRLYRISQVSGECNNHHLVLVYFQDELRCFMSTYIIIKEERPF